MKADVLDTLFGARDQISDVLISTVPQNPDDLAAARALFQRHNRLTGAINQLIEIEFKPRDISAELTSLEQVSSKLEKVTRNINGVRDAIGLVDQAVTIIVAIIAMVL